MIDFLFHFVFLFSFFFKLFFFVYANELVAVFSDFSIDFNLFSLHIIYVLIYRLICQYFFDVVSFIFIFSLYGIFHLFLFSRSLVIRYSILHLNFKHFSFKYFNILDTFVYVRVLVNLNMYFFLNFSCFCKY